MGQNNPLIEMTYAWIYYANMLSKDKCEKILKTANNSWKKATVLGDQDDSLTVAVPRVSRYDKIERSAEVVFVKETWLLEELFSLLNYANNECQWNFIINGIEDVQITKYNVGDFYNYHTDGNGVTTNDEGLTRKLSMSIILNDDYEGGEFEIWGDNMPIKYKTGTVILFPSYFVHKVNPITKGIRYSLVAWFGGPKFQ